MQTAPRECKFMGQVAIENGARENAFTVRDMKNQSPASNQHAMQFIQYFEQFRLGKVFQNVEGYYRIVRSLRHLIEKSAQVLTVDILASELPRRIDLFS